MKTLTAEEASEYKRECCTFKDYESIDEYIEDVVICLVYSSWHYSEKEARECVEERMAFVKDGYKNKLPANKCCADVGYYCG